MTTEEAIKELDEVGFTTATNLTKVVDGEVRFILLNGTLAWIGGGVGGNPWTLTDKEGSSYGRADSFEDLLAVVERGLLEGWATLGPKVPEEGGELIGPDYPTSH